MILVAGTTGMVGREVVRTLRERGAPVRAAVRQAGVRHVAVLSVGDADKARPLPLHAVEALVAGSGIPCTQPRPTDVMRNFATVHAADRRERDEIWAPAGAGRASHVDMRDIGDVTRLLSAALGRAIVDRRPGAPRVVGKVRRGTPLPLALVMTTVYAIRRIGLAAPVSPDLGAPLGRDPTRFARLAQAHRDVWARPGSGDATAG